jgi:hypothetical protein
LESLKDIAKDEIPKKEEILSPPKTKSSVDKSETPQKSSMEQSSKIVVKQSGEKSDKKKSNKFNYESVIEITLPSQSSILSIPQQQLPSKCQDDERIEEPITPIISAPTKPKSKKEILKSPSSKPESKESLVSNKQQNMNPLEWDSFMGLMPVSS